MGSQTRTTPALPLSGPPLPLPGPSLPLPGAIPSASQVGFDAGLPGPGCQEPSDDQLEKLSLACKRSENISNRDTAA